MLLDKQLKKDLLNYLLKYVTENKKEKILEVAQNRTRYITVVLENINKFHDINAVIRSCECFGIQNLHIIENTNQLDSKSSVSAGSSKWIDIKKYNSSINFDFCLDNLKENNFKIIATSPLKKYKSINEIDINDKLAIFFGDDKLGLSSRVFERADEIVSFPSYGFTESLNLSSNIAISLYNLVKKLHKSNLDWKLSEDDMINLEINWIKKVFKKAQMFEDDFLQERNLLIP